MNGSEALNHFHQEMAKRKLTVSEITTLEGVSVFRAINLKWISMPSLLTVTLNEKEGMISVSLTGQGGKLQSTSQRYILNSFHLFQSSADGVEIQVQVKDVHMSQIVAIVNQSVRAYIMAAESGYIDHAN